MEINFVLYFFQYLYRTFNDIVLIFVPEPNHYCESRKSENVLRQIETFDSKDYVTFDIGRNSLACL